MILVTGATGIAGSQVVRALLEQGQDVRAFVRDPDKARGLFGDAVELARGDFAEPRSLRAALDGVEALFLSGADDPRRVEWETAAIDAAAAAGVRRIVKLSSIVARPGAPVAFWDWHGRIEQHLTDSRGPRGDPALELLHVEPARRRRAGGSRRQALRAGGRRADRDDRSRATSAPPRRPSSPRQATTAGPTSSPGPEAVTYAQVAPSSRRCNRSRGRVRRPPRRGRRAGTGPGGPAGLRRGAGRRDLRAGAARRRRAGHGDGRAADRAPAARPRLVRARLRELCSPSRREAA